MRTHAVSCLVVLLLAFPGAVRGENKKPGKVRVLLLGDSAVIGKQLAGHLTPRQRKASRGIREPF